MKPGQIEITRVEVPPPGPGEVLIETRANGICRGDVALFTGRTQVQYPFFFGHEPAGIVVEVGAGVDGPKPGDAVACLGYPTFQRHFITRARRAIRIPNKNTDLAVWISEPVACAVNCVHGAEIRPGDKVALLGCGYMGLLILQALPRETLGRLAVADPDGSRLGVARSFNAPETYDPRETDLPALAQQAGGFDIVIEASGEEGALSLATEMVRPGGKLIIFGWHHGEEKVPIGKWHLKGLRVLNITPRFAEDFDARFQTAVKLLALGKIDQRPLITCRFAFSAGQKALEAAAASAKGYLKGVIVF